jgi:hypothetical protein
MSAFVVSKAHIDAMIRRGLALAHYGPLFWYAKDFRDIQGLGYDEVKKLTRTLTDETADAVGQMLIDECVKSVSYRYQDDKLTNLPGPTNAYWLIPYQYQMSWGARMPNPVEALKLISCYEYQSCEHPEWHDSEAKRFCESLRHHMIAMLPGYDDAPWEWREKSEALAPTPPDPEGRMKSPYDFPLSKTEIDMAEARSMAPTPPADAEIEATLKEERERRTSAGMVLYPPHETEEEVDKFYSWIEKASSEAILTELCERADYLRSQLCGEGAEDTAHCPYRGSDEVYNAAGRLSFLCWKLTGKLPSNVKILAAAPTPPEGGTTMLKREDFNILANSRGYKIEYKGQNIGGAGIAREAPGPHGSDYLQHVKDYLNAGEKDVEQILAGEGPASMKMEVARIFELASFYHGHDPRLEPPTPPMKLTAKQSAELKGTLPSAGDMFINLGDGTIRHITVHLGKDGDWYTGTLLLDAYLKSIVNEVTWETEDGPTPPALSADEKAIPGFGEKFERCVLETKAKGGAVNPYAACRANLRRSHGLLVGAKK